MPIYFTSTSGSSIFDVLYELPQMQQGKPQAYTYVEWAIPSYWHDELNFVLQPEVERAYR